MYYNQYAAQARAFPLSSPYLLPIFPYMSGDPGTSGAFALSHLVLSHLIESVNTPEVGSKKQNHGGKYENHKVANYFRNEIGK